MHRKAFGAAAVVLAVGAAGCGGGAAPLTRAQFTHRAEVVCAQAGRHAPMTGTGLQALLTRAVAVQHAKATGIGSLTPPKELKASYQQYAQAIDARLSFLKRFAHAMPSQLTSRTVAARGQQEQAAEARAAAGLGLRYCREDIHHHEKVIPH